MQKSRTIGHSVPNATRGRNGWTPRSHRAKSVGEFVPKLMRPTFEKFGFPAAAILTDWAAIAGPELAAFTAPERLKWPRRELISESTEKKTGATLILRVAGARALDVEHMRPQLIERINAAFGYRAVYEIKVLQAPLHGSRTVSQDQLPPMPQDDDHCLQALPDGTLKTAFTRMARGLKMRQCDTETGLR